MYIYSFTLLFIYYIKKSHVNVFEIAIIIDFVFNFLST